MKYIFFSLDLFCHVFSRTDILTDKNFAFYIWFQPVQEDNKPKLLHFFKNLFWDKL